MLHACVQKFDVTGRVENFLGTQQGLIRLVLVVAQEMSNVVAHLFCWLLVVLLLTYFFEHGI